MSQPGPQFDNRDAVIAVLDTALSREPYLLGDSFSAADVALGGLFGIAMYNKRLPALPSLVAYNERLAARPANRRARAQTWPG
jgi:glutathione S-transferase